MGREDWQEFFAALGGPERGEPGLLEPGTGWTGRLGGWAAFSPSAGLAQFRCPRRYVRPLHTLLSALVVTVALGALVWAAETQAAVRRCRRSHPAACLAAVLAVGLLVLWAVGGACTFLLSVAGPVLREYPPPGHSPSNGRRLRTAAGRPCPKRGLGRVAFPERLPPRCLPSSGNAPLTSALSGRAPGAQCLPPATSLLPCALPAPPLSQGSLLGHAFRSQAS